MQFLNSDVTKGKIQTYPSMKTNYSLNLITYCAIVIVEIIKQFQYAELLQLKGFFSMNGLFKATSKHLSIYMAGLLNMNINRR